MAAAVGAAHLAGGAGSLVAALLAAISTGFLWDNWTHPREAGPEPGATEEMGASTALADVASVFIRFVTLATSKVTQKWLAVYKMTGDIHESKHARLLPLS